MSVDPPGVNGTTRVMFRLGYVSAFTRAEYAIVIVQAAAPERKWRRVRSRPTDFFGKRSITSVFLPGDESRSYSRTFGQHCFMRWRSFTSYRFFGKNITGGYMSRPFVAISAR